MQQADQIKVDQLFSLIGQQTVTINQLKGQLNQVMQLNEELRAQLGQVPDDAEPKEKPKVPKGKK